jgi:hypothetical protein
MKPARALVQFAQKNLPLVIPKPGLSARNLLAAGSKAADSSRNKAALRNENSLWHFQIRPPRALW